MRSSAQIRLSDADRLIAAAASCARDPLRFVLMAYPWAEPGGPLAKHSGPDTWQAEVLAYIRDNLSRAKPLQNPVFPMILPRHYFAPLASATLIPSTAK